MSHFKKPRFKSYVRLAKDIRNDFKTDKFNRLKWSTFKKIQEGKKITNFFHHFESQLTKKHQLTSNFGNQRLKNLFKENLLTKQRLATFYKLQSYKFKTLIRQNAKKQINFLYLLERRLDVILYRTGFVKSLSQSRQLISHKKVSVNKHFLTQPNFLVKKGDLIEIQMHPKPTVNTQKLKRPHECQINLKKSLTNLPKIDSYWALKETKNFPVTGYLNLNQCDHALGLPNHLETNYKTLSTVFLGNISLKKSFNFWVNNKSVLAYYKTH
uniref:Ribosomal protein S4 n=1 Tax=Heterosigma akashiwo TaxID=2829 RepID=A0A2Z6FJ11_HETAK|nr:ribosomal protein S4 [Heterosigma akashiwo]